MARDAVVAFCPKLRSNDEVVIQAIGNTGMIVCQLRLLGQRVVIANAPQLRAIVHAKIKTDKIDADVLAKLTVTGFLPSRLAARRRD